MQYFNKVEYKVYTETHLRATGYVVVTPRAEKDSVISFILDTMLHYLQVLDEKISPVSRFLRILVRCVRSTLHGVPVSIV